MSAELLAENKRLRVTIKQLEADVTHHNQGWNACVVENNGLREQLGRFMKLDYTDGSCRDDLRGLQIAIEGES